MNVNENIMILNGKKIEISEIDLDKSALYAADKNDKYSYCVHIYNWDEIHKVPIGEKYDIEFNEYNFCENGESALIWPTSCYIEKTTINSIRFYFKFDDFTDACYMNMRGHLDTKLESLEINVNVEYELRGNCESSIKNK